MWPLFRQFQSEDITCFNAIESGNNNVPRVNLQENCSKRIKLREKYMCILKIYQTPYIC